MRSGYRRQIALALIVSLILLPVALPAKARQGVGLNVVRKDGSRASGELIAVKQASLLLLSPVGKDDSVEIIEISSLTIVKKSKAGIGLLSGLVIGGVAGGLIYGKVNPDDPYFSLVPPSGGTIGAFVGGLVGLALGAAAGANETIEFRGLSEAEVNQVLARLRGMARMPAVQ